MTTAELPTLPPTVSKTVATVAAAALPRLLPPLPVRTLVDHLAWFGPAPRRTGLIDQVEAAGLRGRGGAGFPTGAKMRAVAAGRRAVVVANGTEGEPLSAKDKTLLSISPHLVLDGVVAAAEAVGAKEAIICIERSATAVLRVVSEALAERRAARIDRVAVRLEATPARYVAGEASALVHWLNGGEARPTYVATHLSDRGVGGRPTLVDNVETLAHLALIARHGAGWFRSAGTAEDPGSALLTVSGAVSRPGVYEIPLGVTLRSVLAAAGSADVSVVLLGGYFGTWIPGSRLDGLTLDAASLASEGASIGCGAIAVLGPGGCGLAETARITRWLADQNAGQCGPCVLGLPAIATAMETLVTGGSIGGTDQDLRRWLGLVKGRGACKHPDGVARFVESSLLVFRDEIEAHRRRRRPCPETTRILPTPAQGAWR